jgi:hypothetical protein
MFIFNGFDVSRGTNQSEQEMILRVYAEDWKSCLIKQGVSRETTLAIK